MIFDFITAHKPQKLPIQKICDIFQVSRSGYCNHRNKEKISKNKGQKVRFFTRTKGFMDTGKYSFTYSARGIYTLSTRLERF